LVERLDAMLLGAAEVEGGRRSMLSQDTINLARLDLPTLRLVILCAEAGTLSAAADACHMSVSGASHKLSRLEESLGTRLFERHRHGLEPTAAGRAVARASHAVLGTINQMALEVTGTGQRVALDTQ